MWAGNSRSVTECLDKTAYPLLQKEPCNTECSEQWSLRLVGEWSDCILAAANSTASKSTDEMTSQGRGSLNIDGVGLLTAAQSNCGIGRRYHSVVCHIKHTGENVSAAQCSASGNHNNHAELFKHDLTSPHHMLSTSRAMWRFPGETLIDTSGWTALCIGLR